MKTLRQISSCMECEAMQIMTAARTFEEVDLALDYCGLPRSLELAGKLHAEGRTKIAMTVVRAVGAKMHHYRTGLKSSDTFMALRRRAISRG